MPQSGFQRTGAAAKLDGLAAVAPGPRYLAPKYREDCGPAHEALCRRKVDQRPRTESGQASTTRNLRDTGGLGISDASTVRIRCLVDPHVYFRLVRTTLSGPEPMSRNPWHRCRAARDCNALAISSSGTACVGVQLATGRAFDNVVVTKTATYCVHQFYHACSGFSLPGPVHGTQTRMGCSLPSSSPWHVRAMPRIRCAVCNGLRMRPLDSEPASSDQVHSCPQCIHNEPTQRTSGLAESHTMELLSRTVQLKVKGKSGSHFTYIFAAAGMEAQTCNFSCCTCTGAVLGKHCCSSPPAKVRAQFPYVLQIYSSCTAVAEVPDYSPVVGGIG